VLHLVHILAWAKHRRSVATAMAHGCKPPEHAARPPRPGSGQAVQPRGCAGAPWCSASTQPPPISLLRPSVASSDDPPSVIPVKDLARQFDLREGPFC
jgi:hypothetical protein